MDADGQHDPAEIAKLVAAHERAPDALVVGVRSFAPEDMPRRSRVGNRISTWWISRFAGVQYHDTQSGFRVYPSALFDVPLRSTKFDTETELLLRAAKMKLPLVEVPIKTIYRDDHSSHFHGFADTLRVIKLVIGSPLWLLLFFAAAGCAHVHGAARVLPAASDWRTMRAEHKVTITVGGKSRTVRGLVAVERPDKIRLRALGPGGITLFDVLAVGGQAHVAQAIRDPNDPAMARIVDSVIGDLGAAFDLAPRPPDRTVARHDGEATIAQAGLTVRETPTRIDIDDTKVGYRVHVDVLGVERDVALDPALWVL